MAKLIKRDQRPTDPDAEPASLGAPEGEEAPEGQPGDEAGGKRGAQPDRPAPGARAEAFSLRDRAQAQAEEIVAAANAQAEDISARALAEAADAKAEAHAQGLEAGRQEGMAALLDAAAKLGQRAEALQGELVPQLVTLSMAVARRVLGRELQFDPEAVVEIVKQALSEKARQRREITLRVHPDDAAIIREHRAALNEMLSRSKEIGIQEDAEVARHGVVIETEAGVIDAQLEVQLGAVEAALRQVEADE